MQRYTKDTTCPKCLGTPKPKWHDKTDKTIEQLVLKCNWCGYSWVVLPADSPRSDIRLAATKGETNGLRVSVIEALTSGGWPKGTARAISHLVSIGFQRKQIEAIFLEVIVPAIFACSEKEENAITSTST